MIAEILATGDELRTGALVDTNSAYIAARLEENGVEVARHLCVGDDLPRLTDALREIGGRADLAVVTGGLGPTGDDLTAEAAAAAAGVPLELNAEAIASVEAFFAARNRTVSEANRKPAHLPRGARCLPNPVGTAPGFSLVIGRCRFFCLPGVPFEMRRMLDDYVLPHVAAAQGGGRTYRPVATLTVFGLPESVVGERLAGLDEAVPGLRLGLRAKFPEIQVKLYAGGTDRQALSDLLAQGRRWVCGRLGEAVVDTEGRPMQAVVGRLLAERGETLAVAESCTGGQMADWITDVPGSSAYFLLSAVVYANEAKQRVLGVTSDLLAAHGAVHEEIARQMAAGARRVAGATYGLATTGIAGPDGGTPEKPVGTVCIGLATADAAVGRRYQFSYGNRKMNKQIFAMKALDLLRRELLAPGCVSADRREGQGR